MDLKSEKCVPCEGGVDPLKGEKLKEYTSYVPDWNVANETSITKTFKFSNFQEALNFTNKVGSIAEEQGHHPDITLGYGYATISLTTHAIKGLSQNDLIMAVQINELSK